MTSQLTNEEVLERLGFARIRCADLLMLIEQEKIAVESHLRQQLVQEFFFHLVGAADLLAQIVNERRALAIDVEDVDISTVVKKLSASDAINAPLQMLYAQTRKKPLPANPYNDEGYLFRIYNYRNQVTHRRRNPFNFQFGAAPSVRFLLDPRDPDVGFSTLHVREELRSMLELISARCTTALLFC